MAKRKEIEGNRTVIHLSNGCRLVAERNDPTKGIDVFIENENGEVIQDLVAVRPLVVNDTMEAFVSGENPVFDERQFEALVYTDECSEDWTHRHVIKLNEDKEE